MTCVFRIGDNGNGTVYYKQTQKQLEGLIRKYKKAGWSIRLVNTTESQLWFQMD